MPPAAAASLTDAAVDGLPQGRRGQAAVHGREAFCPVDVLEGADHAELFLGNFTTEGLAELVLELEPADGRNVRAGVVLPWRILGVI